MLKVKGSNPSASISIFEIIDHKSESSLTTIVRMCGSFLYFFCACTSNLNFPNYSCFQEHAIYWKEKEADFHSLV